ncbi:MAG: ATP-binding protein [Solirubrobacterales bacterium]|nr:ATP-binding protein [Solirubrobacterales bacterium]
MTSGSLDWPTERVSLLRERALRARRGAELECERSQALAACAGSLCRPQLRVSFPAEADSVPIARAAVVELAARVGADAQQLDSIKLAVSEAVTNAVVHAYPNGSGSVHVVAGVVGQQLAVVITDDGCGMHAPSGSRGLGWGLSLIAASSDRVMRRQRRGGGTRVHVRWNLPVGRLAAEAPRP